MNTVEENLIAQPLRLLGDRIITQKPLSRRGRGPGLLLLTPENNAARTDRKTLDPEPYQKWAEEGFVVVNVTFPDHVLETSPIDLESYLETGLQDLKSSPACTDPDKLGLICMFLY